MWRYAIYMPPHRALMIWFALALITLPFNHTEARYASIVVDMQSGAILHETNADTRNYPASLVKMMTLYLTFEALTRKQVQLDQRIEVSPRAEGMAPSRLGLGRGQGIRAEEAILAIVTKSANDAAVVLAEAIGGSEPKFAHLMNEKARALGMKRTTFRNATGLPHRSQLSTARDMATLARALLRDFPQYYYFFSVTEFRYHDRTYHNHNRLIESYTGADGIKTGYTRASGFNLTASVKRGDHRLIAVVFGGKTAKSRDRHMVKLLDRAFASIGSVANLASLSAPAASTAIQGNGHNSRAGKNQGTGQASTPLGRYGAQVGAYYRYNQAKHAATDAAQRLPESLNAPLVWVPKVQGRNGSLFLARLVGLTENDAKQACQHLRAAAIDCLAIKVTPPTSVAFN
ncbi:MAG: D-alanyl-D-alanine carboxypeptidase family protein [Gammaproteobacteria bacterium]